MKTLVRSLAPRLGLAVAIAVVGAVPAAAQGDEPRPGAVVVHCRELRAPAGPLIGNIVFTPSGHEGQHCRPAGSSGAEGGGDGGAVVLQCGDVVEGLEGNIVFTPSNVGNYHCSPFNP